MRTYSGIKHIFFDLDDTLYDFRRNSKDVLLDLFDEHNLQQKLNADFETFHHTYVQVNKDFWKRYERGHIDKKQLRENRFHETFIAFSYENFNENLDFNEKYMSRAPHGKHLKEGCIEVLRLLQKKYKLHIITNGFKEIQHIKLKGSGITSYFENIIISEEHGLSKPDEKIFRLAEKLSGASIEHCVMIGDSIESDIGGAINAGWKAIWINSEDEEHPVHRISSLLELKEIF